MEENKPTVEQILKTMADSLGAEPRPMVLMSKLIPEWIPRQAQERKFIFDLPNIPPKYKYLIMIAVAAAVENVHCTETYVRQASRTGVTKEEIGEALLAGRFALASTVFATATEAMELLVGEENK